MAIFFRTIHLRSRKDANWCLEKLIRRNKISEKLPVSDTTYSFIHKRYFVTSMSWWDWFNRNSEPKFIGKIESEGHGSSITGYFIPGFGAMLVPILAPLGFFALVVWLGSVWLRKVGPGVDLVQYYSTLAFISIVFLAICSAVIWICFYDRWEDDRLVTKLARVLQADIVKPADIFVERS